VDKGSLLLENLVVASQVGHQCAGSIKKETEVKLLGVKVSQKDDGNEESLVGDGT
jgi:hypothetical protein